MSAPQGDLEAGQDAALEALIQQLQTRIYSLVNRGADICGVFVDANGDVSCQRCGYRSDVHLLRDCLSTLLRRRGAPQPTERLPQRLHAAIQCVIRETRGFSERKQEAWCRVCRYKDPLGMKLHDPNCSIYELHGAWEEALADPSVHRVTPPLVTHDEERD